MRLLKLIDIGLVFKNKQPFVGALILCYAHSHRTGDLMDCCCVSDPGGSTQILQRSHKAQSVTVSACCTGFSSWLNDVERQSKSRVK